MEFLKTYFRFTRKERNGILILIILNIISWSIFIFFNDIFSSNYRIELNQFEQSLKSFYKVKDSTTHILHPVKEIIQRQKDTCIVNINHPKYEHLLCIGVSEKLARTWINYILKGGKFRSIEDVKKLWGMNDSIFYNIEPYLTYNNKNKTNMPQQNTKPIPKKIEMLELNSADTNQLKSLPGIGSSFASRIVKYRQRLGGYVAKEQLKEIFGLNEELFDKISPYLYVDIFDVKKLNINTDDYFTLVQHPYLNKEIVKQILQLRKKQGILNKDDLLNNGILMKEEWDRIKWYIEF